MRIIIVEDETSIRHGLCNMIPKLNSDYYVVGSASNGAEGLRLIESCKPDLVIMDIQMPEMDGLTMLEQLRKKGVQCRVIVLTAYSDFAYAKRAIELNISQYLLKPIKLPEFRSAMEAIHGELEAEKGKEKLQEKLTSLAQILRGCILAELPIDEEIKRITMESYGLDVEEPLAMMTIWLGAGYDKSCSHVQEILQSYAGKATDNKNCLLVSPRYQMVMIVLYHIEDMERVRKRCRGAVAPAVFRGLNSAPIICWGECTGLANLAALFAELHENMKWGLSFEAGTLICQEKIDSVPGIPLKYPADIETGMKKAVAGDSDLEYYRLFRQFSRFCIDAGCQPEDIRGASIRLALSILANAKALGKLSETMRSKNVVGLITQAVCWEEIWEVFQNISQLIRESDEEEEHPELSSLVREAVTIIEEYYDQGITLDELAQRLGVSEEYISTLFKKETGMGFTETVRRYRIDRIKELLLHSSLKLNQIADMVGYTDPKYMSKVFKEEVGVLPAEFRKQNH